MSDNKWISWVQQEVRQKPEQRTFDRRAPVSSMRSPSSSTSSTTAKAPTSPPRSAQQHQQHQQQTSSTHNLTATSDMLNIVLPNPTQCFCRKRAHRVYTSEYGPILVCNNFDVDPATTTNKASSRYVCGFHVHEISWIKFCDTLRATHHVNIDYVELRSCPFYNFTFCAIFRTSNKFDMNPPIVLPKCFCHKPVIMRINRTSHSISFACKNGDVDGAKKCSWILPAHQVAFPRPNFNIHNSISHEEYMNRKQETLTEKVLCPEQPAPMPFGKYPDQPTPPALPTEGHQADLLATLSQPSSNNSNTLDSISDSNIHQPKPTLAMKPLIIPTCVMAKRPASQPDLSRSSSASSCSNVTSPVMSSETATLPTSNTKLDEQQQLALLKFEMSKVRNENSQLKSTINAMTTSFQDLTSKYDRLKSKTTDLQTELHRSKNEHNEQSVLRINCQERLSKIELDVVHLMNDNEKLKEEVLVMLEEKSKSGKDEELNKCRLCFTRNIEYCLIPCYHYAYCQLCAQKLTECAICRTEIFSVQKVYTC
ncbi:uncharacterized protein ATC70_001118 [Mucor velutinosus]|uniref:RING-type domain-containing protein n=1 Tax=Mucor velutinosus TaxID=708070 RepID=A0AAN7HNT3_9FUNG|nr:hypothetical protein ATC70_001118 [Mucor velutinosus]